MKSLIVLWACFNKGILSKDIIVDLLGNKIKERFYPIFGNRKYFET
jgi:hypothetical protein